MVECQPLVSIGMPVYNDHAFLRQTLDCLLNQDLTDFELVISDNASTDATEEICREYASKDRRVRYYRNESNIGAARNFNAVLGLCSGKYFCWAASHDLWEPAFLSACVGALERDSTAVLAFPEADYVEEDGRSFMTFHPMLDTRGLQPFRAFHVVLWDPYRYQVYGVMRREAGLALGGFGPGFAPDVVFLVKLALIGGFVPVPGMLFHLRHTLGTASPAVMMSKLGIQLHWWSGVRLYLQLIVQVMLAAAGARPKPWGPLNTIVAGLETALLYSYIVFAVNADWRRVRREARLAARQRSAPSLSSRSPSLLDQDHS
jgi:glycosyltransferase involved in cell wall biosynthesis